MQWHRDLADFHNDPKLTPIPESPKNHQWQMRTFLGMLGGWCFTCRPGCCSRHPQNAPRSRAKSGQGSRCCHPRVGRPTRVPARASSRCSSSFHETAPGTHPQAQSPKTHAATDCCCCCYRPGNAQTRTSRGMEWNQAGRTRAEGPPGPFRGRRWPVRICGRINANTHTATKAETAKTHRKQAAQPSPDSLDSPITCHRARARTSVCICRSCFVRTVRFASGTDPIHSFIRRHGEGVVESRLHW